MGWIGGAGLRCAASCCCGRVGELRVVDPCLSNVYECLSPPSVMQHQQIVICRIHFYLLNRTDQFNWDSGLKEPHVGSRPYI
jgi:hypothetical protein